MDSRSGGRLVLCGIVGPVVFALVLLVIGSIVPGYSHSSQFMSELGAVGSPYQNEMNVFGFILLGLFIIGFSVGLYRTIASGWSGKIGSLLFLFGGIVMVLVGLFPCDAACDTVTFTGTMHEVTSTVASVSVIFGIFFIARQLRVRESGRLWVYTLLTGLLTVLFSLVYLWVDTPFPGTVQRVSMAIPLVWMVVTGLKFRRIKRA